jgi:hypothetical protein
LVDTATRAIVLANLDVDVDVDVDFDLFFFCFIPGPGPCADADADGSPSSLSGVAVSTPLPDSSTTPILKLTPPFSALNCASAGTRYPFASFAIPLIGAPVIQLKLPSSYALSPARAASVVVLSACGTWKSLFARQGSK